MKIKIAIIYSSFHHLNTQKLLENIDDVDLYKANDTQTVDFMKYDRVGFASGIYHGQLSKQILDLAKKVQLNDDTRVFIIYTCGLNIKNYAKNLEVILENRGLNYVGKFSCRVYDTCGLWGVLGGIAREHPSGKDREDCQRFIDYLSQ